MIPTSIPKPMQNLGSKLWCEQIGDTTKMDPTRERQSENIMKQCETTRFWIITWDKENVGKKIYKQLLKRV